MKKTFLLFLVAVFSLSFFILSGNNAQAWTPSVNEGWFSCFNGLPRAGMEWADVDGADGYRVWRGATNVYEGQFTNFTDTAVDYNTNYHYEIQVLFLPEIIWNNVDGGDINTGGCVYVSNLTGPSSFEATTDSKTYSADYVWGDSSTGVRSLEIYKNGIQLASGSINDLVPPSGVDTKSASFTGFFTAGNYQFCARGTIQPSGSNDLKCMDILVTVAPSIDLDVKKSGLLDFNYADNVNITLSETVDLQWSGVNVGTCDTTSSPTVSNWDSINRNTSGTDSGIGFPSADTYVLTITCSSIVFDNGLINTAHAQSSVTSSVTVTVVAPPPPLLPDLIVDSMTYSPVPGELDETITFLANIKNIGDETAGASTARIRVDRRNDGIWDYSDTEATIARGPGLSTTVNFTWSTGVSGTHRYEVCADYLDVVGEGNEGNNCSIGFFAVAAGSPDLEISGVVSASPGNPIVGQNVSFSATTKNRGDADAESSKTRLEIDVDNNGSWDYTNDRSTGSLDPNETESENWNNVWTAVAGTHKIRVCADALNDVIESNEGNNCATDLILTVSDALVVDLEVKVSGSNWAQSLTGEQPLNNVDLRASVSGGSGNINYTFYCDRPDSGINVTIPFDAQENNRSSETYNRENLCNYSSQGNYTAKVITERNGEFVEDRATITVTAPSNNAPSTNTRFETVGNACIAPLQPIFSWTFVDPDPGDSQTAYGIQVDDSPSFGSPAMDTGKIISSSSSYVVPAGSLVFNETYYWRVRVWDQINEVSAWSNDNSGDQITTQLHAAPDTNFSWVPLDPFKDELISFTDGTSVFGGTVIAAWSWVFPSGAPSSSSAQNPSSTFGSIGTKNVSLNVTDSDGFSCSIVKNVDIVTPPPNFKEVR